MSLTDKHQMHLDTDSATHTRMEDQPRSSYRYQLLQAWCSLLTVAMVIMAVHLSTMNQKPTEAGVPTPETINSTGPTQRQIQEPLKSGRSHSFVQLHQRNGHPSLDVWKESPTFVLRENSITVSKTGIYFLYAQVTFREELSRERRVLLERTGLHDNKSKTMAEGLYPASTMNTVWVAKIVRLRKSDSVNINITGEILNDHTYWGVIELQ